MAKKIVNPALIIGIGGTGTKSLFETKVSLYKRYGEIPSCIKLLCFDTDISELMISKKELYIAKGSEHADIHEVTFDASEMVDIPVKNPATTKEHPHVIKWLNKDIRRSIQPSNSGANQIRQKGRFAFFENYSPKRIAHQLEKALTNINSYIAEDNPDYNIIGKPKIHMIFSPNGGTGGGTFLDFAITIQHITGGKVPLSAWMLLPSFFDGFESSDRVHQNGYAALKEIDHMMGVDATQNKPWSNADPSEPYQISYNGSTDVTLGPELSLFENIFVFDQKMRNGKEIVHVDEMYPRIGDIIYEFISGAGDQIFEKISSNFETDFEEPSNNITGNKRRNYFSIGLGHISMDRALIKQFKSIAIIEAMINRYLSSSSTFQTSQVVFNFLDTRKLNELGNNDNDDIIDSLITKSDLKYDPASLLPPEFEKGCNDTAKSIGDTFLARWNTKIEKIINENSVSRDEFFKNSLSEELSRILKSDGGVSNSIQFLSFLKGQFEVMQEEMNSESTKHKNSIENVKKGLVSQQELIKEEENIFNLFNKKTAIKEECINYASKIELILTESMNLKRKDEAGRLLFRFINEIKDKIDLLKQKADSLSEIQTSISKDLTKATSDLKKKENYVTDLTKEASSSNSISSESLTGMIKDFGFENHMLSEEENTGNLKSKIKEYVSNLDEIGALDEITAEEVMTSLDSKKIKDIISFLETSSSPCANINTGFTAGTNVNTVRELSFVTTCDSEVSVLKDNTSYMKLNLGEDRLVSSGDNERITMVQCEGPFPINALGALKKSKERYDANEKREKGKVFSHIDEFFAEHAQDLYKDDSVENAQIFFGIGSALNIIECTSSKYTINFEAEKKALSELGASNRRDRNHAFNYFKKIEKYVNYIKDEYNYLRKSDPKKLAENLLNHFDTIEDPSVIKKQLRSCSKEELKYLNKERLAVANYALDNGYLNMTSYMQRTDDEGNISEKYTERQLRNMGLKFDTNN